VREREERDIKQEPVKPTGQVCEREERVLALVNSVLAGATVLLQARAGAVQSRAKEGLH
jgi:hypothetical protein